MPIRPQSHKPHASPWVQQHRPTEAHPRSQTRLHAAMARLPTVVSRSASSVYAPGCNRGATDVDHIRAVSGPDDPLFWDSA